jgi:hypothetical protein
MSDPSLFLDALLLDHAPDIEWSTGEEQAKGVVKRVLARVGAARDGHTKHRALITSQLARLRWLTMKRHDDPDTTHFTQLLEIDAVLEAIETLCGVFQSSRAVEMRNLLMELTVESEVSIDRVSERIEDVGSVVDHHLALVELRGAIMVLRREAIAQLSMTETEGEFREAGVRGDLGTEG